MSHLGASAAIWGHLPNEPPTLNADGTLSEKANPWAKAWEEAVYLYQNIRWYGGVLRAVGAAFFQMADVVEESLKEAFLAIDPALLRAHAWTCTEFLKKLVARRPSETSGQVSNDLPTEEFVCSLLDASDEVCGRTFKNKKAFG